MKVLRVGTRGSKLALAQTYEVLQLLKTVEANIDCEIVPIKTTGDIICDRPLVDIGGKALFLQEIEKKLLQGEIDFAVHSMKDVPSVLPEGLVIPAVTERLSPEDVLIARSCLYALPAQSVIGTCSPRRKAFLKHIFRDKFHIVDMRGNVDTRLNKLMRGEVDGLILARAGLTRLALENHITEVLPAEMLLPAIGQGCVAIECRAADANTLNIIRKINHQPSFACITAERSFMLEINGNCKTPIAALAQIIDETIFLQTAFVEPNGEKIFSSQVFGRIEDAHSLGVKAGSEIKEQIRKSPHYNVLKDLFSH